MSAELWTMISSFAFCFSRRAAFHWFVVSLFGIMVRLDQDGVTAFVRWLKLDPKCYTSILKFFQASSWNLPALLRHWQHLVEKQVPLHTLNGFIFVILDGIKITKEGLRTPGNKKLHQSSENSGKAPYTFGHHFGVCGLLIGILDKLFCIPVAAEVHEGVEAIHRFQGKEGPRVQGKEKFSVITLGLRQAAEVAKNLSRPCMLVLDAYYAVGTTFLMARECCSKKGQRLLHVITRAKKNIVAYRPAQTRKGRGRPRIYGEKVLIAKLFTLKQKEFTPVKLRLYGKETELSYYCLDLLWKPAKEKIRFVLVRMKGEEFILLCSCLDWEPPDIIRGYSYRFKIEVSFKMLKHLLGAFCYHFWSKKMPRLSKNKNIDLSRITDPKVKEKIAEKLECIERFVNLGCIALGMLQILAIKYPHRVWKKYGGWLRTVRCEIPSEGIVLSVIRNEFDYFNAAFGKTEIHRIIAEKKREKEYLYADDVA